MTNRATSFDPEFALQLRKTLLERYKVSAREWFTTTRSCHSCGSSDVNQTYDLDGRCLERSKPIMRCNCCHDVWVPGEPIGFTCRRCLKQCTINEGSTDLEGLCDTCWCEVDELRERWDENERDTTA